ncbi:Cyclin [Seminavis robusta]|uniref:Cyclin n=1 Tax=Seminavis robusta TaxID=568900 RepID=A0A9N8E6G7_9STRA|nr:Cyclin [Seminavis robusta]|eukprot:Sro672_g185070.1 Cyclin (366) ;mRNA; r:28331-29547
MTSTSDDPVVMSVVDRSIVPILSTAHETPSRRHGISAEVERTHRLYGTSLLYAATKLQKLNASTYATACTIFHRFYHRVSLTKYNVWSVAMASLLLATKVQDGPQQRTIRSIVLFFDHLYRKRRHLIISTKDSSSVPSMSKLGPVWKEYYENVVEMENQVLRELGFTLYWIPDAHPHKFLWEFVRILLGLEPVPIADNSTSSGDDNQADANKDGETVNETADEKNNDNNKSGKDEKGEETNGNKREIRHFALAQRAWSYCNDSCRLDLCVRFDSEVITCAAIYLACRDMKIELPMKPAPWWQLFLGKDDKCGENVATAANAILGLIHYQKQNATIMRDFLPSLVPGGSTFNDPERFLWEVRTPQA